MKKKLQQQQEQHRRDVERRLGDKVPPQHLPFRPLKGRDLNAGEESGGVNNQLGPGR